MKVGRNQPCPCGSGRKYKNCCFLTSQKAASSSSIDTIIDINAPTLSERFVRNALSAAPEEFRDKVKELNVTAKRFSEFARITELSQTPPSIESNDMTKILMMTYIFMYNSRINELLHMYINALEYSRVIASALSGGVAFRNSRGRRIYFVENNYL